MSLFHQDFLQHSWPSINRIDGWDFLDDFSGTDDWTDNGATVSVNTTTDVIDWDCTVDDNGCYIDALGGAISDTAFIYRMKFVIDTYSGTGNRQFFVALSSSNSFSDSTTQDYLGFRIVMAGLDVFRAYYGDGVNILSGTDQTFATTPSVGTYYIQIKRTSSTSFTVGIYSDSSFSTLTEEEVVTVPSTIQSLRYIRIQSWNFGGTATMDGTIDDVKLENNTSTAPE